MIGPIMIGPSSSHTAGACRMSRAARQILGENVEKALLELHGSFAIRENCEVNQALISGLLDYDTDNERIHDSLDDAKKKGISINCINVEIKGAHINTTRYKLNGETQQVCVTVSSLGGSIIEVVNIDGAPVSITGDYNTMIVFCQKVGNVAKIITKKLSNEKLYFFNIGQAISTDNKTQLVLVKSKNIIPQSLCDYISELDGVKKITSHAKFE